MTVGASFGPKYRNLTSRGISFAARSSLANRFSLSRSLTHGFSVLVAGVPEARPLLTQEGAGRDGTVAQVAPLVRIVFGVTVVLEGESTPVDPEIREVRNRRRGVAVRERLVDEMDDRHLVSVRVV